MPRTLHRPASQVEAMRFCRECNWQADQQGNVDQRNRPCNSCRKGFDPLDDRYAWSPQAVDCDQWAAKSEFWLQHLVASQFTDELYAALLALFNLTEREHRSFIDATGFESMHTWPLVTLNLGEGFTLEFLHSNYPEDCDCRAYIDHPEWPAAIHVGTAGGNFQLPAFRWPEIHAIARAARKCRRRPFDAHAILIAWPLFYVTPDEDEEVVRNELASALKPLAKDPAAIARVIAERNVNVSSVRWRHKAGYGWMCEGTHSRRTGDYDTGLTAAEIVRLNGFLGAIRLGAGQE